MRLTVLKAVCPLKGVRLWIPFGVQSPDPGLCCLNLIMFYTYILQSAKSGRYYIGHTNDLVARLERHNTGKATATKNKGPWVLKYYEEYETKQLANSRELNIKSMKSRVYIEKLISEFKNSL
jgi:putative endonuclease